MRVRIAAWILAGVCVIGAMFAGLGYFARAWVALVATGAGVAILGVAIWVALRPSREAMAQAIATARPLRLLGSPRVRCFGSARRLARVLEVGPIQNAMFEPVIVAAIAAVPAPKRRLRVQMIAGVLIFVAIECIGWAFEHRPVGNIYVMFLVSSAGGLLVGGAVFPTYLRVVPGRLDVMECGWLGRQIIAVRRIDLRDKAIAIDLNTQVLLIDADSPKSTKIACGAIWDRWAFAHAVLMAAVSTHTPAPLPDDQLLG